MDHSAFAAFGAELVYGERADGTLAHIGAVASGLACACKCPAWSYAGKWVTVED
ncbi:hypothetical protein [Sphingomonas sp. HMP9]|uniref:hypothetical protein n=1 Tax=Sphingomonas sp. HMP9 TaxID=1517554 RepID=UPI0015964A32|nr:hypothetical protein [Sphingomonas sp. HMP9]